MARPPLDKRKQPSAIVAARSSNDPRLIALQGGDARKRFTDAMVPVVLQRVACGVSVKQCAEEWGISPGSIHQRSIDDPEGFGKALEEAYGKRAHTLKDTVLEVAYDETRTAADKKVIIEALQWTAKMDNRAKYGDQVKVEATHSLAPVVLSPIPDLPMLPDTLAPDNEPEQS